MTKDKNITIRATIEERKTYAEEAKRRGLTLSKWFRGLANRALRRNRVDIKKPL